MKKQARFLNVDLEMRSAAKLDALAAEMGERVSVLFCGPAPRRHLLAVEIRWRRKDPDGTIHALCDLIDGLSPASRRLWKAAQKEFDVGYELRPGEPMSRFTLRTDTLERVARLGAGLAVSYYPGDDNDD